MARRRHRRPPGAKPCASAAPTGPPHRVVGAASPPSHDLACHDGPVSDLRADLVPTPRADLLASEVGDKALLLDRVGERAHLLNASAAWVWDLIDGARTAADITAIIAAATGLAPEVLRRDIDDAIAQFAASGLLVDGTLPAAPEPTDARPTSPTPPVVAAEPAGDDGLLRCGPFVAIGLSFAVRTDRAEVAEAIAPLLVELEADTSPVTSYLVTAAEVAEDGSARYDLHVDGELLAGSRPLTATLETVLVDVNRRAIGQARDRLVFHAGAVDLGGVVLLPAVSGSGKSTLTAALVASGARYLTDEAAVVRPETLLVEPYPKPLSLSAPSLAALARSEISIAEPAASDDEAVAGKRHVPVAHVGVPAAEPAPIAAIVFPTYEPDGPTTLTALSPEDALVELVPCTFTATWEVAGSLDHVVALVESVPAYRLVFADLADAVVLVRRTVLLAEAST